jgi:hypothetical protein
MYNTSKHFFGKYIFSNTLVLDIPGNSTLALKLVPTKRCDVLKLCTAFTETPHLKCYCFIVYVAFLTFYKLSLCYHFKDRSHETLRAAQLFKNFFALH